MWKNIVIIVLAVISLGATLGPLVWPRSAGDRFTDEQLAAAWLRADERELALRQSLERSEGLSRQLSDQLQGSEERGRRLAAGLAEMAGRGESVVLRIDQGTEDLERAISILDGLIEARGRRQGSR